MRELLVVIQARMSSARFPGKVLAPLRGEPVLRHVVRAAESLVPMGEIVVATSLATSDDPLAAYVCSLGASLLRGPLDDVLERFQNAAREHPATWLMRINADSPLLRPDTLARVFAARLDDAYDLVTTVFPRTFPPGQNAELIRSATLLRLSAGLLEPADHEHVTRFFYRNAQAFAIRNIESDGMFVPDVTLAIDTLDDLRRIEADDTLWL